MGLHRQYACTYVTIPRMYTAAPAMPLSGPCVHTAPSTPLFAKGFHVCSRHTYGYLFRLRTVALCNEIEDVNRQPAERLGEVV